MSATISRQPRRPDKKTSRAWDVVAPLAVLALIVAGWYFVSFVLLDADRRFLLPPPDTLVTEAVTRPDVLGHILVALGRTALVALGGLAIATMIGVLWAVAMSQARWVERSLFPYAVVLQTIPVLVVVPLIGFWFGFEYTARVIVTVLVAIFPIVSNTLFGLQSVEPSYRDLFGLQGASRWTTMRKLELPAALPALFAGLRIAAGQAVIGAIVSDFFFRRGEQGIGALINDYTARLQSKELFISILLASLFGIVVFLAFGLLGRLVVGRWHDFSRR